MISGINFLIFFVSYEYEIKVSVLLIEYLKGLI